MYEILGDSRRFYEIFIVYLLFVFHSSYFVAWKTSPRKWPRPGTRKGINRAAAWRALRAAAWALLVDVFGCTPEPEVRAVAVGHS